MPESQAVPQRGQKRSGSHVSRACDACRKRKMRCDGVRPQCGMCIDRGGTCEYNDDDKRKTNPEHMEEMKGRISRLESMIETFIRSSGQLSQGHSTAGGQTTIDNLPGFETDAFSDVFQPPLSDTSRQARPSPRATISPTTTTHQGQSEQEPSPARAITPSRFGAAADYDWLQRVEAAAGSLVQYGPTSLWTYKTQRPFSAGSPIRELEAGDWIDWSRHLPSALNINRETHDRAVAFFSAYYAPWCFNVDMSAFQTDLAVCNLVRGSNRGKPSRVKRTAHYSPLLHNCVLFLGLHMARHEYPVIMGRLEAVFMSHCSALLFEECDNTSLSSLRAYSLFANCAHFVRMSTHSDESVTHDRQYTTGYLYSGQAIAGVHAMGLNINSDDYVSRGLMTVKEQSLREYVYWTVYCQDTIRAFAAGRQPMIFELVQHQPPAIDPTIDNLPWLAPQSIGEAGVTPAHGTKSQFSTCFHWTARLALLCRTVMENLYSPWSRAARTDRTVQEVSQQLNNWYSQFPLAPPERFPLPHILLLHMTYHMMVVFVHRPFYRSASATSASSTGKCNEAAYTILQLLRLFDTTHGIRYCHHNLINVIFSAATVFLLRCVGSPRDDPSHNLDLQYFDECLEYMARLGQTWMEAEKGRTILLSLQGEYLQPPANSFSGIDSSRLQQAGEMDNMQDWLATHDFWGILFPEQSLYNPFAEM